ncbi:hypothetical protein AB0K04_02160 [Micromonospora coxensis]|uniref:hypothetical protein n=1 Tax=Micromonospora coxensis TaxID=356852 RepID=UPI00342CD3F6
MIPEEDRPASWLRDNDRIEADIRQMREFADRLQAEVDRNYAPHLSYIADDMTAAIPDPCDAFIELVQFLRAHHETQQATAHTVWDLGGATGHLAGAAGTIAAEYEGADAFAAARVGDVREALARPHAVMPHRRATLTDPTGPDNRGPVVLP